MAGFRRPFQNVIIVFQAKAYSCLDQSHITGSGEYRHHIVKQKGDINFTVYMNGNTLHHSRWKHLHGVHINAHPGVVLHNSPEKQSPSVYTWKVEMIKYDRLNVGCEKMKGVKDNVKCFGLKNGKDMAVIN